MAPDRTACRSFVVLPAAGHLRRVLGPSTWVVLETLLARSTGTSDASTVTISIRDLAADVALSKDTVTRAVEQLRTVGLLQVVHSRAASGTFRPTDYKVTVPVDMFDLTTGANQPPMRAAHRPPKPSRAVGTIVQLSFTEL